MEIVTHTCGQRLYRHESGGVRRIVVYGDGQREIHTCPGCGEQLADSDLTDAHGERVLRASDPPQ